MDRSAAISAGAQGAAQGALFMGTAVAALHKFHPGFRAGLGVSGKVALVTMSAFFLAALRSEQNIHTQQRANFAASRTQREEQRQLEEAIRRSVQRRQARD